MPGTSSSVSAVDRGALRCRSALLASVTLDEELNKVRLPDVLPVITISSNALASAGWPPVTSGVAGAAAVSAAGAACCANAGAHVNIALPANSMNLGKLVTTASPAL